MDSRFCVDWPCTDEDYSISVVRERSGIKDPTLNVYRIYANMSGAEDRLNGVFGSSQYELSLEAPVGVWNSEFNQDFNGTWGADPLLFAFFQTFKMIHS